MKNKIAALLLLWCTSGAYAQEFKFRPDAHVDPVSSADIKTMGNANTYNDILTMTAHNRWQDMQTNASWSNQYAIKSLANYVRAGVDHTRKQIVNNYKYKLVLKIEGYSNPAAPTVAETKYIDVLLEYDKDAGSVYNDRTVVRLEGNGYHAFRTTLIEVYDMSPSTPVAVSKANLADNFYIETEVVAQYYDKLAANAQNVITSTYNNTTQELQLNWSIPGSFSTDIKPVRYELEWTYIDDYHLTNWTTGAYSTTFTAGNLQIPYSFKNNATRVILDEPHYAIPMVYEHGALLYRLRMIRPNIADYDVLEYSNWTLPESGTLTNSYLSGLGMVSQNCVYLITQPHQEDQFNWQYSISFAEEGKYKHVLNYFDGAGKNRQTLTKVNTDANYVVAMENIYDYEWRPAIKTLPIPVLKNNLRYIPDLSLNSVTNQPYRAADFDKECIAGYLPPFSASALANIYYSSLNPDKSGMQRFVPDAQGYPFVETIYAPDQTNKVIWQGGAGLTFQRYKKHGTRFAYVRADQPELNRLLGTEAGYAMYYPKQITVDPNRQISYAIYDAEGKIVLTGLAGTAPDNDSIPITALSSLPAATTKTYDMYTGDQSAIAEGVMTAQNSFYVESGGINKFQYKATTNSFPTSCAGAFLNVQASYKQSVVDECGTTVAGFDQVGTVGTTGIYASNQVTNKTMPELSVNLAPGKYTIVKELAFSDAEAKSVVSEFVDDHTGYNDCYYDRDHFVRKSVEETEFPCEGYTNPDEHTNESCDIWRARMKAELYPGAKYGAYTRNASGGFSSAPTNSIFGLITDIPGYYCIYKTYYLRYVETIFTSGNPPTPPSGGNSNTQPYYNPGSQPGYYDVYEQVEGQPYYSSNPNLTVGSLVPGTVNLHIKSIQGCYGSNTPSSVRYRYQSQCIGATTLSLGNQGTVALSGASPDQLLQYFNDDIAEALLPLHPEYCKLRFCDNGFADQLMKINTYNDALAVGLNSLAGILSQDPLCQNNNAAAPFAADILSHFFTQAANGANMMSNDNKVDVVALKYAYCGSNSGEQTQYCAAVEYASQISNMLVTIDIGDVYFNKLKEYYLSNRSYLIQKAMDGTLSCSDCFNAKLTLIAPSVVPSLFDAAGNISNPDLPADVAADLNGYLGNPDPYGTEGQSNPYITPGSVTNRTNDQTEGDCALQIDKIIEALANCGLSTTQKDNIRNSLYQQSCGLGYSGSVITYSQVRQAMLDNSVSLSDLCQPFLAAYNLSDLEQLKDKSTYVSKNSRFYTGIQSFLNRSNVLGGLQAAVANSGTSAAFTLVLDQNNLFEKELSQELLSGANAITVQCTYIPPATNVNVNPVLRINVSYGAQSDILYLTNRKVAAALPATYVSNFPLGTTSGNPTLGLGYSFERVTSVVDDPEYLKLAEGGVANQLAFLTLRRALMNGTTYQVEYTRGYYNIWSQKLPMLRPAEANSAEGCVTCEGMRRTVAQYYAMQPIWNLPTNTAHPFFMRSLTNYLNLQLKKQHTAEAYETLMKGCALSNQISFPSSAATMSAVVSNLATAQGILSSLKTNALSKDLNIPSFVFVTSANNTATIWWDFGAVPYAQHKIIKDLILSLAPAASYLPATSTAELFVQSSCASAFQTIAGASVTMTDVQLVNLDNALSAIPYKWVSIQANSSTATGISDVLAAVQSTISSSTCGIAKVVYGQRLYRSSDYGTADKQSFLSYVYNMQSLSLDDVQDNLLPATLATAIPSLVSGAKVMNYVDPWCAESKRHLYYYKPQQTGHAGYDRLNTVLNNVKTALSNRLFLSTGSQSISHSFGANASLKAFRMADGTMYYQLFDGQNKMYSIYLRPAGDMRVNPSQYTAASVSPVLTGGATDIYTFKVNLSYSNQTVTCYGYTDFPIGTGSKLEDVVLKSTYNGGDCLDTFTCERQTLLSAVQQGEGAFQKYITDVKRDMVVQLKSYMCTYTDEELWHTTQGQQYQHTLYYYDLAGNLTRTVPPEGVHALSDLQAGQVDAARSSSSQSTNLSLQPAHSKVSRYRYNSHNQLVWQQTPDGGITRFYYDYAGRLIFSQNAVQQPQNLFSYTIYDGQSRVEEIGVVMVEPSLHASVMDKSSNAVIFNPLTNATVEWTSFIRSRVRKEVVFTRYDQELSNLDNEPLMSRQENLRKRVSAIVYTPEVAASGSALNGYQYATHFSYDAMGNVQTLTHDNPYMEYLNQRYKRIDYDYDLLSGKVNMLSYNRGQADQYYQRYLYDADNRLEEAYTSNDGIQWDKDAAYTYYKHGPLAEVQMGDLKVQGVQYAYTIQGWLKAINGDVLVPGQDMGKDGYGSSPSDPANIYPADLMVHALDYHAGDYQPIEPGVSVSHSTAAAKSLYNGNIARQTTGVTGMPTVMRTYTYDQLNRITDAQYSLYDSLSYAISSMGEAYRNSYTYDADGNILTLNRKNKDGVMIDQFTYHYYAPTQNNRLSYVSDAAANIAGGNDLKQGQQSGNYVYDAIGNLIEDKQAGIRAMHWSTYGKLLSLAKGTATADTARLDFYYDAAGNRIRKDYYHDIAGSLDQSRVGDVYVRDAQGNILAVYKHAAKIDGFATISGINSDMLAAGFSPASLGLFFAQQFAQEGPFVNSILDYLSYTGSPATSSFVSSQLSPHPISYYYMASASDYAEMMDVWFAQAYTDMVTADWQLLANPLTDPSPEAHVYTASIIRHILDRLGEDAYDQLMMHMVTSQNQTFATEFCNQAGQTYDPQAATDDRIQQFVGIARDYGTEGFGEIYYNTAKLTDPLPFLVPFLQDGNLLSEQSLEGNPELRTAFLDALGNADYGYKEAHVNYMTDWLTQYHVNWLSNHMTPRKMLGIVFSENPSSFLSSFIQELGIDPVSSAVASVVPMSIYRYYGMLHAASGSPLPATVGQLIAAASPAVTKDTVYLSEHHLYGSSRLGIKHYAPETHRVVYTAGAPALADGLSTAYPWYSLQLEELIRKGEKEALMSHRQTDTLSSRRWLGQKSYELSDHLGNVLVSYMDRKTGYGNVSGAYAGYQADVVSATDYYPFGFEMSERSIGGSNRFGFNGQERTDEIAGKGNHNTALFWEYDTRVARRWNVDPVYKHGLSNYATFANNPIIYADPNGLDSINVTRSFSSGTSRDGQLQPIGSSQTENMNIVKGEGADVFTFTNRHTIYGSDGQIDRIETTRQVFAINSSEENSLYGHAYNIYLDGLITTERPMTAKETVGQWMNLDANFASYMIARTPESSYWQSGIKANLFYGGGFGQAITWGAAGELWALGSSANRARFIRSFDDVVANPKALWGMSVDDVGSMLGEGWTQGVYGSKGTGWKFTKGDQSIFYHPGGGRHGGSYYGFSSGKLGKNKIVGPDYKPLSGDKATIINIGN